MATILLLRIPEKRIATQKNNHTSAAAGTCTGMNLNQRSRKMKACNPLSLIFHDGVDDRGDPHEISNSSLRTDRVGAAQFLICL